MNLRLLIIVFLTQISFSQNRTCGTDAYMENLMSNPVEWQKHLELQAKFEIELTKLQNTENRISANTIYIPVAVHFPEVDPDSSIKPCLQALAQSQVNILNADYNATNADLSNWTSSASGFFPGINVGNLNVQFVIANSNHPIESGLVNGDLAITFGSGFVGGDFDTTWAGYINLVCKNAGNGTLGYSPLGGSPANGATVVIAKFAFGSGAGCPGYVPNSSYNLGRTLTHELGHFFNLSHTFSGCSTASNCSTAGDRVCDTPPSNNAVFGCPTTGSITRCGVSTLTMNYMDYTNDACMYMFTAGQATRMQAYYNVIASQLNTNVLSSNAFLANNFSINPNPNSGTFVIQLKEILNDYSVEVFDVSGRVVYEKNYSNNQSLEQNIVLNNTQSGVYFLSIKSGSSILTKKIIVQ
jgi:hypothetical protein